MSFPTCTTTLQGYKEGSEEPSAEVSLRVFWSEMSSVYISPKSSPGYSSGFSPAMKRNWFLPKTMIIWLLLSSFAERGWCKNGQGHSSWKSRSHFEQHLDVDQAELQWCWRRAGFRAGSGFYNCALTSGLPVRKGLGWFILHLCESQHCVVGGSARAVGAPTSLWSRESHLNAGVDIQMCASGQLTHT